MTNIKGKPGIILIFVVLFLPLVLHAEDTGIEVISEGYVSMDFPSQNTVVKDKEEIDKLLETLGDAESDVNVDFNTETVALIVPDKSTYPDRIRISGIEKNEKGILNVSYVLDSTDYVHDEDGADEKPYKLVKLFPAGKKYTGVSFKMINSRKPVFVNNSVENIIRYSNIMEDYRPELFINYLPLDKGNSWTYDFESPKGKGSQTYSIVTYSNGWSLFDSFFGVTDLAMRLDRSGNIYVSTDKGIRSFYNQDVVISFSDEPFKTGAGEYRKTIIVSAKAGSPVIFKDIYAKDIGLVYHEHESKGETIKYSLSSANVRGRRIP